jgi:hypothetical protein
MGIVNGHPHLHSHPNSHHHHQLSSPLSSTSDAGLLTVSLPATRHPLCSTLALDQLFSTLSVDTIIGVLACLLTECRILFHAVARTTLTHAIQSFLQVCVL